MSPIEVSVMKPLFWLDKAAEQGLSGNKIAAELGISRQTITKYRNGRIKALPPEMIYLIARDTDLDAQVMLADQAAEKASSPEAKKFWKGIATAACVILSLGLIPINKAESTAYDFSVFANNIDYAQLSELAKKYLSILLGRYLPTLQAI